MESQPRVETITQESAFEFFRTIELYRAMGPEDILRDFLNGDPHLLKKIDLAVSKIDRVAHIGLEVPDIERVVHEIDQRYPDDNYQVLRQFSSVSIPARFPGSEATIAQVESSKAQGPRFELFEVKWPEPFQQIPPAERKKLIEHVTLATSNPQDLDEVLNALTKGNPNIFVEQPPTVNLSSGEVFAYLRNQTGRRLEIICQLTEPEIPAEPELIGVFGIAD